MPWTLEYLELYDCTVFILAIHKFGPPSSFEVTKEQRDLLVLLSTVPLDFLLQYRTIVSFMCQLALINYTGFMGFATEFGPVITDRIQRNRLVSALI